MDAGGSRSELIFKPNVSLSLDNAIDEARELMREIKPSWGEDLEVKSFDDGITNKVFGFFRKSDSEAMSHKDLVLFRIYGEQTDKVVDRKKEITTLKMLQEANLGPKLYCIFGNGLSYEFLKGVPLDEKLCRDPTIMKLVATIFAEWHVKLKPSEEDFDLDTPVPILKCRQWLNELSGHTGIRLEEVDQTVTPRSLGEELASLEVSVVIDEPLVFSHNDTLLANIIFNKRANTARLIDYEYGGPNYRAFDIGNHFDEMCGIGDTIDFSLFPKEDEQKLFIGFYLTAFNEMKGLAAPSKDDVQLFYRNVGKMCALSHFYWGVWSFLQSTISKIDFDYTQYAKDKLTEYFKKKHQFLNL